MAEKKKDGSDAKPRLVDELVEKAHLLALVNGVLRTTVAAESLPEVLEALAPNLKELCPFDRLSVSLYDPRRRQLHTPYVYTKGRISGTGEGARPSAGTPAEQVILSGKPLLRRDSRPGRGPATDTAMLRTSPGCEAIFPLLAREQPFGTFQITCLEPDRLADAHVERIEELLPAIASAVHRFAGVMPSSR